MFLMTLALTVAASPVVVRVDLTDALRLPSGFEAPSPKPLVIFVRAPAAWVHDGVLTESSKKALLAQLYGGPGWENGNADGSTYVVKRFTSRVLGPKEPLESIPGAFWYEVRPDGTLEKKGPLFGAPASPPKPRSLIDEAIPGSVFKQGVSLKDEKTALAGLAAHQGEVKLPVTLARGQVGFTGHGAKAGALVFRCDDSKLGVSLADRARERCGDASTCELWLIGHWKKTAEGFVLEVTKVDGAVSGAERGLGAYAWYPG